MDLDSGRRPIASRSRALEHRVEGQPVVLTDIDIPFERMVAFMVKWSVASIPAAIVLIGIALIMGWLGAWLLLALGLYPL